MRFWPGPNGGSVSRADLALLDCGVECLGPHWANYVQDANDSISAL